MASKNKVAIITGASRGIGARTAMHLAKKGFDVVVCSRTVKEGQTAGKLPPLAGSLEKTAADVRAAGRKALVIKLDILEKRDVENVVEQTMKEFGRVDVMMNNAAKFGREGTGPLLELSIEEVEKEVFGNIVMPLYFTKLVVPTMIQQGGGMIINVSSEASRWDAVGVSVGYAISKAGLGRQAAVLANELREKNVAVINVEPGLCDNGHLPEQIAAFGITLDAPAATIAYIATHPHPMSFSGKIVDAPTFAIEHALVKVDAKSFPDPYGPTSWGKYVRAPRALNPWS